MAKIDFAYANISYFLIALLGLSFFSFYPTYFLKLDSLPFFVHIHYTLMIFWTLLVIAQPLLIKAKKFKLHRTLGKLSYGVVPVVLIFSYMMLRHGYMNEVARLESGVKNGTMNLTPEEILHQGRLYASIALYYIIGFVILYPLAIINRKQFTSHAVYMVAVALMLTGPIVDRAIFYAIEGNFMYRAEYAAFVIIDIILLLMLYRNFKMKTTLKPVWICIALLVGGQIVYTFFLDSWLWQKFVSIVM
jgi:hypothetical protein